MKEQKLTFCVSGQLWNRSLVMLDTETKTLWSQILGRAMKGELKGSQLRAIPADMVAWSAWRDEFPETTVLAMPRTRQEAYTNEFYNDPRRFVVGFKNSSDIHHCSFATLVKQSVLNVDAGDDPLVISFDKPSTSARLFRRNLDDGTVLTFIATVDGLKDHETGSEWNRVSGEATSGKLKGKRLVAYAGIVSYAKVWKTFHPRSVDVAK